MTSLLPITTSACVAGQLGHRGVNPHCVTPRGLISHWRLHRRRHERGQSTDLDIAGLEAITGAAAEAGAGLVNDGQAVQLRLAWVRRLGLGVTGC